jgi:transcriptional regulator with XRE-family HTH domain
MSNINPSSAYRELGRQLLQIRQAAGLTTRQLADKADVTKTQISRMENGLRISSTPDVILYVMNCGLTMIEAKPLVELCRIAERKVGYYISDARIGGSLQSLIFHETAAEHLVAFEPLVVPGLLQTPNYARAQVADLSKERMMGAVRTRMERQRILSLRNPGRFNFYIHEQALRLPVASHAVMAEQLLHLVLTTASENVTVRVVPSAAGARSVFGGPFKLLEFQEYRPLVYLDQRGGGLFIEDTDYVRDYHNEIPRLADVALDEDQSRSFMADLADEYDQRSEGNIPDALTREQLQRRKEVWPCGGELAKESLQP